MSQSPDVADDNVKMICQWLREQLRKPDEKDIANAVSALQKFLIKDQFRFAFSNEDGINLLASLVKNKGKNVQLLYQTIYCLWLLSYSRTVSEQMNDTKVIPNLVEVLKTATKEKVVRMTLATLRNLLDKSTNNEMMIDCGIVRPLENLQQNKWADEDIIEDLKVIHETLQKNITILSSFDVYKKEILSGNLEWSTVHRSEKFWRENSHRLEEDNHKLLLVLKELLTSSANPLVLSVACFDIGEFARFHPRGKIIIGQTGIKIPLMKLMEDKDQDVRKNALMAVQKLMVTNWEYIGSQ